MAPMRRNETDMTGKASKSTGVGVPTALHGLEGDALFPLDIIVLTVRWYLRYRLSYADVAELFAERGVAVGPPSAYAWVRVCPLV